jgi:hypothetical protein
MDRAEKAGLGVALVGHAALLAILSLNLMSARPKPPVSDPMDVMLVDAAAAVSSSPTKAIEAPQAAQAPELGPVEDASPPPEPTPAPPVPKPAPAPAPSLKPAPKPEKPREPVKPSPAKPTPTKPSPAKAETAKPAPEKPVKGKPKASNLGDDFLKGIPATKSQGKGAVARAAVISPIQANGLAALIASQVKPCYTVPTGGADAMSIITQVRLRLKPDGSIAVAPEVTANAGVNGGNQAYLRQMNEAAVRALQRCAPYKLPPELYEGGWEDIKFNFRPNQMN